MPNLVQNLTANITRHYPFYSGCGSLANSGFVRFLGGAQPGKTWCNVAGGEVLVDLSDYVGRAAFYAGDLDRKITWVCRQIIRDGDTVLDIGANIGMVSVLLSDLVGKTGTVHSFEPNPSLSDVVNQAVRRNDMHNTTVHPIALGSGNKTLRLLIPIENAGAASLVRNMGSSDCQAVDVPVRRLDDICRKEKIAAIRLIKIDVEGFETDVFLGARQLLSSIRPDAILFELNKRTKRQIGEEPLIRLLKSYGYGFFEIPRSFCRMRLRHLNLESDRVSGNDYLAAPLGKTFDDIAGLVKAVG